MSSDDPLYHILLEKDRVLDPRPYAAEIAALREIPLFEARTQIRKGGGIPLENLPEELATAMYQRLSENGIPARMVLVEGLSELPPPARFSVVSEIEEGLCFGTAEGQESFLAWEEIALVSAGLIAQEGHVHGGSSELGVLPGIHSLEPEEASVVKENLILKMHGDREEKTPGKPLLTRLEMGDLEGTSPVADLLARGGSTWIRIPGRQLIFSTRVRLVGALAFSRLAKLLTEKRQEPAFTPVSLKLFQGNDIKSVAFSGLGELTAYTRWQFHLKETDEE